MKEYEFQFSQVAPNLQDGLIKQSTSRDIYSYGRVIKWVLEKASQNQLASLKLIIEQG